RRHRTDVAHAHANSGQGTVAEIKSGEGVVGGGKRRHYVAGSVENSGDGGNPTGTNAILPETADNGSYPKAEDGEREGECNLGERPVCGAHERLDEHAPAVHRAQTKLHEDRCYGDSPTICETICGHG